MDILSELFAAFSMQFVNALCDNSGADFGQRMQVIQNASNEMICQMIGAALSTLDDTLASQAKAEGEWMVLRKAERELETSFGCIRFWRRYYRNRHSGKTCHLLDVHLGITAGQRVSNDVRHRAVVQAVEQPYAASGRSSCPNGISKASVANYLSDMQTVSALKTDGVKRGVPHLYVEADEDHVALQNSKNAQVKLIYVHEGREKENGRAKLKNPQYLTWPLNKDTDSLWEHVASYIEDQYDTSALKQLFLSGDGADWIRAGEEWLPGCIPILDGYHVSKALMALTAHMPKARDKAYKLLYEGDREAFKQFVVTILQAAPTEKDRHRKRKQANYLLNNWRHIQNRLLPNAQGCSAEAHVSHILSARLSSRPLGWSESNLVTMAQLRVMKANGETIAYPSVSKCSPTMTNALIPSNKTLSAAKKALKQSGTLAATSLPVLIAGKTNSLYQALHGLCSDSFAS